MHILLCIQSLAGGKGGAERTATNLGAAMIARGHQVSYAFFSQQNSVSIPSYSLHPDAGLLTWNDSLTGIRLFREKLKKNKPDIALIFYASSHVMKLYEMFNGLDIPLCYQECSNPYRITHENWGNAPNAYAMRNHILQSCAGIRVTQEKYRESFPRELQDRVYAFPNAFTLHENNSLNENKTILHVGGAKKNKQILFILQAFDKIQQEFPDWKLVICTLPAKNIISQYVYLRESLLLRYPNNNVEVVEDCDDMDKLYANTAIHCITSLSEGLPNCVCESMCHGIPSIGFTDSIGTNSLIENGKNGLLVSSEDRGEALAEGLARLMRDAPLRHSLGERAWQDAHRFDPQTIYDTWEKFFHESLQRSRKSPFVQDSVLSSLCFNFEEQSSSSWTEALEEQLRSIKEKEVIFWGYGQIYKQFSSLCKEFSVRYIVSDFPGAAIVDNIPVVLSSEIDIKNITLPIIIFSGFAKTIEHRLRTEYNLQQPIVCMDTRLYADIKQDRQEVALEPAIKWEEPKCAFCGSDETYPYMSSDAASWFNERKFSLVRCARCNLVYASPRPQEAYILEDIRRIGKELYEKALARPFVQERHNALAEGLLMGLPRAKTAFDVAFGAGTMLHAYRKLGIQASGNEVNPYACRKLAEQGFNVFNMKTSLLDVQNKYDIITAINCIEYSCTPFNDLMKIHSMLSDDGVMYLGAPYLGCPDHVLQGDRWDLFKVDHISFYFPEVLEQMVRRAGFQILSITKERSLQILARK